MVPLYGPSPKLPAKNRQSSHCRFSLYLYVSHVVLPDG
uniref:Uncharacterized protein n=1 Tax=Faecalibaculum rodentium TaxID=1702221 RepID=A0A140DWY2_9FIRM|nr:hypothetical protein AALO17_20250 [Faecalibaculum rodentium]